MDRWAKEVFDLRRVDSQANEPRKSRIGGEIACTRLIKAAAVRVDRSTWTRVIRIRILLSILDGRAEDSTCGVRMSPERKVVHRWRGACSRDGYEGERADEMGGPGRRRAGPTIHTYLIQHPSGRVEEIFDLSEDEARKSCIGEVVVERERR